MANIQNIEQFQNQVSEYLQNLSIINQSQIASQEEQEQKAQLKSGEFFDSDLIAQDLLGKIIKTKSFGQFNDYLTSKLSDPNSFIGSKFQAFKDYAKDKLTGFTNSLGANVSDEDKGVFMETLKKAGILPENLSASDLLQLATADGRKNFLNQTKARVTGKIEEVKSDAENLLNQTRDQATGIIQQAQDQATGIIQQAQDQATGLLTTGRQQISELQTRAGSILDQGEQIVNQTKSKIEDGLTTASDILDRSTQSAANRLAQIRSAGITPMTELGQLQRSMGDTLLTQADALKQNIRELSSLPQEEEFTGESLQTPRSINREIVVRRSGERPQLSILEDEGGLTPSFFSRAQARISSFIDDLKPAFNKLQPQIPDIQDFPNIEPILSQPIESVSDYVMRGIQPGAAITQSAEILESATQPIRTTAQKLISSISEDGGLATKALQGVKSVGSSLLSGGVEAGAFVGLNIAENQIRDVNIRRGIEQVTNIGAGINALPESIGGNFIGEGIRGIGNTIKAGFNKLVGSNQSQELQTTQPEEIEMQEMNKQITEQEDQKPTEQDFQNPDPEGEVVAAQEGAGEAVGEAATGEAAEAAGEGAGEIAGEVAATAGETIASAIPILGELLSFGLGAGLLGASLFEGSQDDDKPPPAPSTIQIPTFQSDI